MMHRRPKAPYHHGDLRRALLDAAFRILRRSGAAALSLREVARQALVSHQAPYHHFPSREHLLAALAVEGFEQLERELEHTQAAAPGPVERAQATGVHYVVFAARNPERFRLMFGAELGGRGDYPELLDASARVFRLLTLPFGLDDTRTTNPVVLTLWSGVHGLASLVVDGQVALRGAALERAALAMTETLWTGVAARLAVAEPEAMD